MIAAGLFTRVSRHGAPSLSRLESEPATTPSTRGCRGKRRGGLNEPASHQRILTIGHDGADCASIPIHLRDGCVTAKANRFPSRVCGQKFLLRGDDAAIWPALSVSVTPTLEANLMGHSWKSSKAASRTAQTSSAEGQPRAEEAIAKPRVMECAANSHE